MRHTLNVIGMTYIGKRNLQTRAGVCPTCKCTAELQDYDASLWFTVAFIPLIPLGQRHVRRYCMACGSHVLASAEWQQDFGQAGTEETLARIFHHK